MTPREAATRTLAEAMAVGLRGDPTPGYRHTPRTDREYEALAARILAASPALTRWLELGAAWDAVEAALPDAKALGPSLMHYEDYTGKRSWIAEWYAEEGARPCLCTSPLPDPASPCGHPTCNQRAMAHVHMKDHGVHGRHPHVPTLCATCHHPIVEATDA